MEPGRIPGILAVGRVGGAMEILIFLAGTMVGTAVGVFLAALLSANRKLGKAWKSERYLKWSYFIA